MSATQPYLTAAQLEAMKPHQPGPAIPPVPKLAVVLMCAGTRGDVQPFIALGLQLQVCHCIDLLPERIQRADCAAGAEHGVSTVACLAHCMQSASYLMSSCIVSCIFWSTAGLHVGLVGPQAMR